MTSIPFDKGGGGVVSLGCVDKANSAGLRWDREFVVFQWVSESGRDDFFGTEQTRFSKRPVK